jgi:hypothetical protein
MERNVSQGEGEDPDVGVVTLVRRREIRAARDPTASNSLSIDSAEPQSS